MRNLHPVMKNTLTNKQIVLPKPIDEEVVVFDDSLLITETDAQGIITYANRRFCKVSGYEKEELIGMHYSITQHPDMPEGLFIAMKKIVGAKKIWRGYIKSLAKSGKYYWTLMYVQAKIDEQNNIVGYTATRRKAYKSSLDDVSKRYEALKGKEHVNNEYFMRAELYHGEGVATKA